MSSDEVVNDVSSVSLAELEPSRLLRRHYLRLKHQRERILKQPAGKRRMLDTERWNHALAECHESFQKRETLPRTIEYDTDLPITNYRDQIIDLLVHRQVLVLCGETGSGKSTQLPKLCLEAGLGKTGWIGHTQPRRIAARSVAARIAEELDSRIGDAVGFKVRFNDQTKPESLIKLMTDGVLLAEIQRDRFLDAYDCIIVDEAHERSLNIDLLMAYLQRLLPKRPDLRVIITSATIDAERFAEHFVDAIGPAPVVLVEGRSYPVEIRYRVAQD
ncbi:MAG: DEAD/DEAH box helicase, partial [Pirellula sp.]